ncbi:MAG: lineage-specific thermal regulator protein [Firmicutes bacterium ADurb.Bin300]|nr:MAG: lineage-specific thermal regulator protein [Firmicutes bacterium ADurb.Bin300]
MLIRENFRRASAELIVLHLLLEEDLYGYQIVQKIKISSKGLFTLPEGTLYPVMYRLTSKGLISEFHRMVNKRMRKYYHLEPDGLAYYETMLCEYKSITEGIANILNSEAGDRDE